MRGALNHTPRALHARPAADAWCLYHNITTCQTGDCKVGVGCAKCDHTYGYYAVSPQPPSMPYRK